MRGVIRVGFVLLTHSAPEQIASLVRALNELYDAPPVVCHHDFSQCALDKSPFSANVRFVEPHWRTFWGCFAIIPAAMAGIRLLMDRDDPPDWFYLLSGSDYPAAPPDDVLSMLVKTPFDVFIDHREIGSRAGSDSYELGTSGFTRPSYVSLAYRRYCAVMIRRPSREHPWSFPPEGRSYLLHPLWRRMVPGAFSPDFRCFAGEHWFAANSKAAEILLADTERSRRLFEHLRTRECPEECYYHSIFGNSSLNLSHNNLRYIDWPSETAWHPRTLSIADLPAIRESGAHFTRKVSVGSPLSTELNRVLGISGQQVVAGALPSTIPL